MSRKYHFKLPYEVSGWAAAIAVTHLQQRELFYQLPRSLQDRLTYAAETWKTIKVTKEDLDELPDDLWARIAQELQLSWSK
jgi:hypothetical protein